jgi:hypothetical protein
MADAWSHTKKSFGGNHNVEFKDFDTDKDASELQKYTTELKKQHDIELNYDGVPTIYKVSGGKIDYYLGDRTAEKMKEWIHGNKTKGGKKNKKQKTYRKQNTKNAKKRSVKKSRKNCWFW